LLCSQKCYKRWKFRILSVCNLRYYSKYLITASNHNKVLVHTISHRDTRMTKKSRNAETSSVVSVHEKLLIVKVVETKLLNVNEFKVISDFLCCMPYCIDEDDRLTEISK
jgi:hypothetical protein